MKQIYFFFIFLLAGGCLSGQCPIGDVILNTQAEVDYFSVEYPNCTEIRGNIQIGFQVQNLEGLSMITKVGGDFIIHSNFVLLSLEGLNNLDSINGSFTLQSTAIKDLEDLENLKSIGGRLSIIENPNLESLTALSNISLNGGLGIIANNSLKDLKGLEHITSIKELTISGSFLNSLSGLDNLKIIDGFFIFWSTGISDLLALSNLESISGGFVFNAHDNPELKNFNGLEKLHTIGETFQINANVSVNSLEGLENLDSIGNLEIYNNPELDFCCVAGIREFLQNPNSNFSISNNKMGCNSLEEVLFSCGELGQLNYTIFYDENQNGIQESNELVVPNIPIKIEETSATLVSGSTNIGRRFLDLGNYTISFIDHPDWESTTSLEQNIELTSSDPVATISFGVFPKTIFSEKITTIQSDRLRCGETISFEINVRNLGTTLESGTLWFEIDPLLTDFTSNADVVNGNTLGWNFENLHPGHDLIQSVEIQIPVPPDIPVGEILNFKSFFDNGENEFEYNIEMRCAYDPNDKLVSPSRQIEVSEPFSLVNYTTFDEDLFYTIRFQNTGNDAAYDIVIRDTLDANLDASTFKIVSSSHPEVLNVSIEEEQNITFEFKDIFLPDSTTNFDASNGYVSYMIRTKEGLAEETPIQNTASIFFDFNPPIVTNTTENLMVSQLPTTSSVNENHQLDIQVFPNPTDGKVYLSGVDFQEAIISVHDLTGRLILVEKSGANELVLPKTVSGMLFLTIETEEGTAVERIFKN